MKIFFTIALIIALSSCRMHSEEVLIAGGEEITLPSTIRLITPDSNSGAVVSPELSLSSYNIYSAGNTKMTFESIEGFEGYWIVEIFENDSGMTFLVSVDSATDTFSIHYDRDTTTSMVETRDETLSYYQDLASRLPDLDIHEIYYFDATQSGDTDQLLNERFAFANTSYAAADALRAEQAEEAAMRAAEEREAERLEAERLAEEEAARLEAERLAEEEAERERLRLEQETYAQNREQKIISFSDGTDLSFCIPEATINSTISAAAEEAYFTFLSRLESLRDERLCTARLSMSSIEEMTVTVEVWEEDPDVGRIFMVGSIPRNFFSTCDPCDNLRDSDRLYFITYNEVGGEQFGWRGYEQFIADNRAINGALGVLEFLLTE